MTASGLVQTVLGPVRPEALGVALPHEHILADLTGGTSSAAEMLRLIDTPQAAWEPGQSRASIAASWLAKWAAPITPENRADVQRNFFYYGENCRLLSVDDAVYEVGEFTMAGGGCIVDATTGGRMARDPAGLQRVSRATGVHVVMSTGYYLEGYHPADVGDWSEDAFYAALVQEASEGVAGVLPGAIKVGVHNPPRESEARVLRAAARAQATTGLPLTVHPGSGPTASIESIRTVEAAGGDPTRTVALHVDHRLFELGAMEELARTGCYLSFDNFGRENSSRQRGPVDLPNDATRLTYLAALAERGYAGQLLMSHDAALKANLHRWGGLGYDHILTNVVPLMKYKCFPVRLIDQILVDNPRRMLTID